MRLQQIVASQRDQQAIAALISCNQGGGGAVGGVKEVTIEAEGESERECAAEAYQRIPDAANATQQAGGGRQAGGSSRQQKGQPGAWQKRGVKMCAVLAIR